MGPVNGANISLPCRSPRLFTSDYSLTERTKHNESFSRNARTLEKIGRGKMGLLRDGTYQGETVLAQGPKRNVQQRSTVCPVVIQAVTKRAKDRSRRERRDVMSRKHSNGCGTLRERRDNPGTLTGTVNIDGAILRVAGKVKTSKLDGLPYMSLAFAAVDDCAGDQGEG